jgi:hypothetical protein
VNGRVELSAPAGVSHARLLLGERRLRAGRHMVVVTFREDGRDVVTRIPIRTT